MSGQPAFADSTVDGAIARSEVLSRANDWVVARPSYSQTGPYFPDRFGRTYRRDCSGLVSMAWHLGTSRDTNSLSAVTGLHPIQKNDLRSGDIMLTPKIYDSNNRLIQYGHTLIFEAWTSSAHTAYSAYEFGGGNSGTEPPQHVGRVPYPYWPNDGRTFAPYRYDNIVDDGTGPVGGVPVAQATASTTATSAGSPITFDGSASSGGGLSYQWYFGDGSTALGQSVQYAYLNSGAYTVTLVVTDSQGRQASATLFVEVAGSGVKGPVASIYKPGGNTEVFFTDLSGNLKQSWYTPDPGYWSGPTTLPATDVRSPSCGSPAATPRSSTSTPPEM